MNAPSSPTPPPSPASSLPSSSDDSPEAPRQLSNFPTLATSSAPLSVTVSSFSFCISTLSSSMANGSAEPTSSTNGSSSPMMASCSGFFSSDEGTVAGGSSGSNPEQMSITYSGPADHCPSSSKSRLDVDTFHTCSSNNFSSEVSSSNMDVDISPFLSSDHDNTSFDNEAGCSWGPDSSGETESSFSQNTLHIEESFSHSSIPSSSNWQQEVPGAMGETVVSRSTWQVKYFKSDTRSEEVSPHWSSDLFTVGANPSDVSSTGPPESDKLLDENASCSRWPQEDPCDNAGDDDVENFSMSGDPVNSSEDVEIPVAMCSQDSSEGAVGMSWPCDSPNSTYTDANISPSPSSTTLNTTVSPSPWPPPLSSFPHSSVTAASVSSTQHCPSNSIINSTSVPSVDASPQVMSWRARASSSPISLTRVAPTTPPPRPPTPPCPSTPPVGHSRRAPSHYASTQRSVSPQDRLQSPATVRRSVSPPLCHPSRSTPPTPSRRSISPPLHGLGLSQRMNSPRRSVSPVALQQALAQPPSPSGRRRLSSRPRSARTPSPRPPRPPNSTPEPSPSPSSQHSPRPHYAKMRGR